MFLVAIIFLVHISFYPSCICLTSYYFFTRLEKEILDRYLDVVLKGNKDGLKVIYMHYIFMA